MDWSCVVSKGLGGATIPAHSSDVVLNFFQKRASEECVSNNGVSELVLSIATPGVRSWEGCEGVGGTLACCSELVYTIILHVERRRWHPKK